MTISPHESVAIAQIVFYVPMVPIAIYVCIRNWAAGPRMAWFPIVTFTMVRFVGGILTIVDEKNPGNIGIMIATIVLLGIGVVPLLLSFLGLIRLVLVENFKETAFLKRFTTLARTALVASIALLSASGAIASNMDKQSLQRTLSEAGYVILALTVVAMVLLCIHLFTQLRRTGAQDMLFLQCLLLASPFLLVRTVYGLLGAFQGAAIGPQPSMWNALFGSAVAFAVMGLLPEYIVLCIYLYLGFHRIGELRLRGMPINRV